MQAHSHREVIEKNGEGKYQSREDFVESRKTENTVNSLGAPKGA
jgi:hypothetical protein